MLYGSSGLPPPSSGSSERLRLQIHAIQWHITPHCSRYLFDRLPTPHFRPSTLGPENHPSASEGEARHTARCWTPADSAAVGSFSRRKNQTSSYGPYYPGTFHCLEVVRRLSQASRKVHKTSSHNDSIRSDTTRSHAMLPCFHKASSQLQYSSSTHFRASSIPQLGLWGALPTTPISWPTRLFLLDLLRLFNSRNFTHFLVGVIHVFPVSSFDDVWQKTYQSAWTRGAPSFVLDVFDIYQRLPGIHIFRPERSPRSVLRSSVSLPRIP